MPPSGDAGGSLAGMTERITSSVGSRLGSSSSRLSGMYDLAMLDLDGVVYVGKVAVPGAAEALTEARGHGMRLAYITNNASRTVHEIAAHLRELSMPEVKDEDVVTSAQAVAHLVADAVPAGSPVLLVGGDGLRTPLEERGLRCVTSMKEDPVAVVQGFHPDTTWRQLAEASYAIQSGIPWFVSNADLTIPTARGIAPGNGSLVQAVANATRARPTIAGKPEQALFDETVERVGGTHPLMVGDRLDTDIDGAIKAGIDSLVVLTGVSSWQDIVDAGPGHRPTYVSADLEGLNEIHPPVDVDGDQSRCGRARATRDGDLVRVEGAPGRTTEALRAALALAWHLRDDSGVRVTVDGTLDA